MLLIFFHDVIGEELCEFFGATKSLTTSTLIRKGHACRCGLEFYVLAAQGIRRIIM